VRNDTGVFEGGEISTFYDPMIAKLCTWAPTRKLAIEAMAEALDAFEVEGVGHNLPFLSTVMQQKRFQDGRLTTGYIAEEFPDGFTGAELGKPVLEQIAIAAAAMNYCDETFRWGGETDELDSRFASRSVFVGGERFEVVLDGADVPNEAVINGGEAQSFGLAYAPGQRVVEALMHDDTVLTMKIDKITGGYRIRTRGADLPAKVLTPHVADLMTLMPVKVPPDMSKFLLCPMPGQVVRLDVKEGDIVEDGQALAIVEAMKMENVLRAEKRAVVSKIHVEVGSVLAVDEVILEFEDA